MSPKRTVLTLFEIFKYSQSDVTTEKDTESEVRCGKHTDAEACQAGDVGVGRHVARDVSVVSPM